MAVKKEKDSTLTAIREIVGNIGANPHYLLVAY